MFSVDYVVCWGYLRTSIGGQSAFAGVLFLLPLEVRLPDDPRCMAETENHGLNLRVAWKCVQPEDQSSCSGTSE